MLKKRIVIVLTCFLLSSLCYAQEENLWLTKMQLMEELIFEISFDRLNVYIQENSDEIITLETTAKIICSYLNLSPVYSAVKKSSSPYIERLIIEGIWPESKNNPSAPTSIAEWSNLWKQAKEYKDNMKSKTIPDNKLTKVCIAEKIDKETEVYYKDKQYKALLIHNTNYISLEVLKQMGMQIEKRNESIFITKSEELSSDTMDERFGLVVADKVYISDKNIYIGYLKTIGLSIGDDYYIPVKALNTYYNVYFKDQVLIIEDKVSLLNEYIQMDDDFIINCTDKSIILSYTDLFWNGKKIIEEQYTTLLLPNDKVCKTNKLYALDSKVNYISTIILRLETETEVINNFDYFGQNNIYLFNIYTQKIENISHDHGEDKLKQLFPETFIMATLKRDVNLLKKGQQVEILSAESGKYYIVLNSKKNRYKVPWDSLNVPKEPTPEKGVPTTEEIESFINNQNISSKTQYLVWTDLYRQRTYIFKGSKNNWKLIKNFLCSTGKNRTPTPKGLYELQAKVPYFGVDKGYMCKNAFQIYDDYLYHSIIFDKTGKKPLEGKGVLGHQASEGCIRFSEEDSLWFYNNMTKGTRVWIR